MGPKKRKTRLSSVSCYGPASPLQDAGSLYTLRDILAAVEFEKNMGTSQTQNAVRVVEETVRRKFIQANPRIPLISESSAQKKIERAVESARLESQKRLSLKRKNFLLNSLDKIFDLVTCRCSIIDCLLENHGCSGAHIVCGCPGKAKVPDMEAAWLRDE